MNIDTLKRNLPILRHLLVPDDGQIDEEKRRLREQLFRGTGDVGAPSSGGVALGSTLPIARPVMDAPAPAVPDVLTRNVPVVNAGVPPPLYDSSTIRRQPFSGIATDPITRNLSQQPEVPLPLLTRPRNVTPDTGQFPNQEQADQFIFNKTDGGFDRYAINPDLIRRDDRPQDTIRRIDLGRAINGQGDPEGDSGSAMFARPGDGQPPNVLDRSFVPITRSSPGSLKSSNVADPSLIIRPRRVGVDTAASEPSRTPSVPGHEPFGSSGEVFGSTRIRRTQPRDYIADDAQYLRDLENAPIERSRGKSAGLGALQGAAGGPIGAGIGALIGLLKPNLYGEAKRDKKIARAREQLGMDLGVEQQQGQTQSARALAMERLSRAPQMTTRVLGEGEYQGVPAGTEIRQSWDPQRHQMIDVTGRSGQPVVAKAPPHEKAATTEIKYNAQGHAVLVPKDGGPAKPIFNLDGTPLTKQANESGNVQTAYRLADDGITQIQVERDSETGQWVDSVGRDQKPLVRGRVGRIDTATGSPTSAVMTNERLTRQQGQESQRKRRAYEGEVKEWGGKEATFRQNKAAEDEAIRTKTDRLQALYQEKEGGNVFNRGGRTSTEIETEKARLKKEIETHRTNAAHFQTEADKAASAATQARRNAGLSADSSGSQGVIGRAPAGDGKHHYTKAEIRAQAESSGATYESLYGKLKSDKRVVIDQ